MGSPTGPLMANIFMDDFENKCMSKLKELGVNLYLRYVDDLFVTLNNKNQVKVILDFFNCQHPNIKFTVELEENSKLSFLDVLVSRQLNQYHTSVYHKKTFTGIYLNWTSLMARKYKISLIKCSLNRIWRICSKQEDKEIEIRKLRIILSKNEYPPQVINDTIEVFVKKKHRPNWQAST
jgi:hypothetical protein